MGTAASARGPRRRSRLAALRVAVSSGAVGALLAGLLFAEVPAGAAAGRWFAYTQLLPALLHWRLLAGSALLLAFPLVLLTSLVVGRAYCSFLCPLGAVEDLAYFLSRKTLRPRLHFQPAHRWLRLATLVAALSLSLLGSSLLLSLLEPYSIVHRGLWSAAALLGGRLRFSVGPAETPPGRLLDAAPLLLSALLLFALVVTAAWKGRLYCTSLCPAGAVLALTARFSLLRIRFLEERCTFCGACERRSPARCIDLKARRIDTTSCVVCFSCLEVCRHGALRYGGRRRQA